MIKKTAILLLCAIPSISYAAKWKVSDSINQAWGTGSMNYCTTNTSSSICIGESAATNCAPYTNRGARIYDDEFSLLLMIARDINEHGALFCPTQADAPNNDGWAWTEYREVHGNKTCVWLCKDGYSGDKCQTPPENATGICDINPFLRANYSNTRAHFGGSNNEDSIPLFELNKNHKCNTLKSEYDMALVISKWLASGNGAFAQKMIIRGYRKNRQSSSAAIALPSSVTEVLVCKNGYKANMTNTDCEPIDADKCNATKASTMMCDGWNISKYSETEHTLKLTSNCYKYGCTKSGYAFVSPTDHTCAECATSARDGVHPENGTCVKCQTGKIFNEKDVANNYCSTAIGLTKSDLMYGRGKTQGNAPIKDQCWTKTSADEYKECVMSGGGTPTE